MITEVKIALEASKTDQLEKKLVKDFKTAKGLKKFLKTFPNPGVFDFMTGVFFATTHDNYFIACRLKPETTLEINIQVKGEIGDYNDYMVDMLDLANRFIKTLEAFKANLTSVSIRDKNGTDTLVYYKAINKFRTVLLENPVITAGINLISAGLGWLVLEVKVGDKQKLQDNPLWSILAIGMFAICAHYAVQFVKLKQKGHGFRVGYKAKGE